MVNVDVEYCGACDYSSQCKELSQVIHQICPNANVTCKVGRQGAFEVKIDDQLVYSKRQTMAFPDFNSVAENVQNATEGKRLTKIREQKIDTCTIM